MTFEEYLISLPREARLEIIKFLADYGEPNGVLKELADIPPCVQNERFDVRINNKYVFLHRSKSFWYRAYTWLFRMKIIKYCYFCYEGGNLNKIGLIGNTGGHTEITMGGGAESLRTFNAIRTYVTGFENVSPVEGDERNALATWRAGIHINARYELRDGSIFLERTTFFGRPKEELKVQNIQDILWCSQLLEVDSEAGSSYIIDLYCLGQKAPCRLYFESGHAGFLFVLELKKRIPHLLYGYNEEYEEIFNRDPAALLAIGKSKMK